MSKFFGRNEHPNKGLNDPKWQRGAAVLLGVMQAPVEEARARALETTPVAHAVGCLSVDETHGFIEYVIAGGAVPEAAPMAA